MEDVLRSPKEIRESVDWKFQNHPQYVECKLPVTLPDKPWFNVLLAMTAHVNRQPQKAGFTLIFNERIFALDVNPAMIHNNRDGSGAIDGTHWTLWPCDNVELDNREMIHQQWFNQFLQRANINFFGRYEAPPYRPEQITFL